MAAAGARVCGRAGLSRRRPMVHHGPGTAPSYLCSATNCITSSAHCCSEPTTSAVRAHGSAPSDCHHPDSICSAVALAGIVVFACFTVTSALGCLQLPSPGFSPPLRRQSDAAASATMPIISSLASPNLARCPPHAHETPRTLPCPRRFLFARPAAPCAPQRRPNTTAQPAMIGHAGAMVPEL